MSTIGLLNEKPLHASLKQWYAQPGDRFEVPLGGFVIDIVRGDWLIEIQTGNFASIKRKLNQLTGENRVRLIYPIVQEKWIVQRASGSRGGDVRRKSPKRGRMEDLFRELVSIPQLLANRNFSLEVLMIHEEEARRPVVKRRRRSKGWGVEERRLLDVVEQHVFHKSADWMAFLPEGLDAFTTKDLATANGISRDLAQKMAYCLRNGQVIEMIGKQSRDNLYRAAKDEPAVQ